MPVFLVPLLPGRHGLPRKPFRVGKRNSVDPRKLAERQATKTTTNRLSDVCSDCAVCAQNDETRQCRRQALIIICPFPMATKYPSAHPASSATMP